MPERQGYNPELQAEIRKSVDGPVDLGRSDEGELEKDNNYENLDFEVRVKDWENNLMSEFLQLLDTLVEPDVKTKIVDKDGKEWTLEDMSGLVDDDGGIELMDEFRIEENIKVDNVGLITEVFGLMNLTKRVGLNYNEFVKEDGSINLSKVKELFRERAKYIVEMERKKLRLGKIFVSTIINKSGVGHIERGSGEGFKKETYERNAEFKRILEDKMLAYYKVEITDRSEMSKEDREIYDNMVRTSFDGHYKGYVIPSIGLSFTVSDLEGVGTYVINAIPEKMENVDEVSTFFKDTSKYPRRLIKWDKEGDMEEWVKKIEEFLIGIENDFELSSTKKNVGRKDWTLLSLQEDLRILGVKTSDDYHKMRSKNSWLAVETLRSRGWLGEGEEGWDEFLGREPKKKWKTKEELQKTVQAMEVKTSDDYDKMRSKNGWLAVETLRSRGWLGEGEEGWDEFLGREPKKKWKTKEESQKAVQEAGVTSSGDYDKMRKSNGWLSAQSLKNRGWLGEGEEGWDEFLGRERMTLEKLQEAMLLRSIKSSDDYDKQRISNGWPIIDTLKRRGWLVGDGKEAWDDFLGRERMTLEKLREAVQSAGVRTSKQYDRVYTQNGWPARVTLKRRNWIGKGEKAWDDFLGRKK
ncbi:MAG: hypothetical protein PHQ18_04540 [Patescibacteria group bacterium]|nr:hypothetical protein [Patescibacteria group bacterium]